MKLKIFKTVVLMSLWLCFTHCSVDNVQPINRLTEEIVITNEVTANAVLNGIYKRHRSLFHTNIIAAMGYYGPFQTEAFGIFGDEGFDNNNVQNDNGLILEAYKHLYGTINEANFFIELVEGGAAIGLAEVRKTQMLAEARFFRAMAHFHLLRIFGQFYDTSSNFGIVISLKPIRTDSDTSARSTVKETYDSIIADLEYAKTNGRSGVDHFYVSATTAQALLAKVQLYAGDYTNAATNALGVINNTDGYALETTYADIFSKRWQSSEVLFAPFVDGLKEGTASTGLLFNSSFIASPSVAFKAIANASDGVLNDDMDDFLGTPISGYDTRFLFTYGSITRGISSNGKYPFISNSPESKGGNTFYYLRMAEVYLIYAEAEARRTGGNLSAALDRLNQVRNRAGTPAKTLSNRATLLTDIRNDKVIELCTENAESYYDLIRYDQLGDIDDVSTFKTTLTDDKFILPIPRAALAGNPLLIQNP